MASPSYYLGSLNLHISQRPPNYTTSVGFVGCEKLPWLKPSRPRQGGSQTILARSQPPRKIPASCWPAHTQPTITTHPHGSGSGSALIPYLTWVLTQNGELKLLFRFFAPTYKPRSSHYTTMWDMWVVTIGRNCAMNIECF